MGEVLSAQGKEMSEKKSNLAALSTQMAAMMEEVKKNRIHRAQSRSPFHRKGDKQGCYRCEVVGHSKRECPRLGSPTVEKRVSFQDHKEALNSKGATRGALSQPLIANIQDLKELKEGEEVDIGVPPPTWEHRGEGSAG